MLRLELRSVTGDVAGPTPKTCNDYAGCNDVTASHSVVSRIPSASGILSTLCLLLLLPQYLCGQSGSLDTSFNPGSGIDLGDSVYSIAVQTNGQILIAGSFNTFNGVARTNIARLNPNGSLDTGFDPGPTLGSSFPYLNAVVLQVSGKVLLGGSFTTPALTNLARLNTNGTLDSSFVAGTDANGSVSALAVQTNGSVVVGGSFSQVKGVPRSGVARLSSDGLLDSGYTPGVTGALSEVLALALQSDGKIVLAGSFTNVNGSMRTNIARLNTDGSLDTSFQPVSVSGGNLFPAFPGIFYALAVDAQGRVIAGGDFGSVNGMARTNLVRFNGDGKVDPIFNPAAGTDYAVNSIIVQTDGKILIGGSFTMVNGAPRNYIARLNNDGTLDNTFDVGTGASDLIYTVALQPDSKVLIGGGFTSYNGTNRSGIARLQNSISVPAPTLVNPVLSNTTFRVSVATISGKSYILQFKNALTDTNWTSLPSVPGDGTVKIMTDNSATVARRFYRVQVQ
jgi:uncharacterized delta-60 repeat protein